MMQQDISYSVPNQILKWLKVELDKRGIDRKFAPDILHYFQYYLHTESDESVDMKNILKLVGKDTIEVLFKELCQKLSTLKISNSSEQRDLAESYVAKPQDSYFIPLPPTHPIKKYAYFASFETLLPENGTLNKEDVKIPQSMPSETVTSLPHYSELPSAFKVPTWSKLKSIKVACNSNNSSQALLKKSVNIDRTILRIIGKTGARKFPQSHSCTSSISKFNTINTNVSSHLSKDEDNNVENFNHPSSFLFYDNSVWSSDVNKKYSTSDLLKPNATTNENNITREIKKGVCNVAKEGEITSHDFDISTLRANHRKNIAQDDNTKLNILHNFKHQPEFTRRKQNKTHKVPERKTERCCYRSPPQFSLYDKLSDDSGSNKDFNFLSVKYADANDNLKYKSQFSNEEESCEDHQINFEKYSLMHPYHARVLCEDEIQDSSVGKRNLLYTNYVLGDNSEINIQKQSYDMPQYNFDQCIAQSYVEGIDQTTMPMHYVYSSSDKLPLVSSSDKYVEETIDSFIFDNFKSNINWQIDDSNADFYKYLNTDIHNTFDNVPSCSFADPLSTLNEYSPYNFAEENKSLDSAQVDPKQHVQFPTTTISSYDKNDQKFITSKLPCRFFIEGSCNKHPCMYSHDLENATCKFWIKSSCLKGSSCPFIHDIIERKEYCVIDDSHQDRSEQIKPYSLDSESDFPPLN